MRSSLINGKSQESHVSLIVFVEQSTERVRDDSTWEGVYKLTEAERTLKKNLNKVHSGNGCRLKGSYRTRRELRTTGGHRTQNQSRRSPQDRTWQVSTQRSTCPTARQSELCGSFTQIRPRGVYPHFFSLSVKM